MATVASGLNSGVGYNDSDTITSTNLNLHVNDATVTNIANADVASNAAIAFTKLAPITSQKVIGSIGSGNAEIDIVGTNGILKNDDALGTSDTQGATQGNIKAYVDAQDTSTNNTTLNLTLGYSQTYSLVTLTANSANQNTGTRPIVVMLNLSDNEGVEVSNDNSTYFEVYPTSSDRGPCTIIVPPNAYYKATKASGSITNQAVILS